MRPRCFFTLSLFLVVGACGKDDGASTDASTTTTDGASGTDSSGGGTADNRTGDLPGSADTAGSPDSGQPADTGQSVSQNAMSFFVTSASINGTGNLGGLAGADKHCDALAKAANAERKKWVAYLSVMKGEGGTPVNARDRIGNGPWYNSKKEILAASLDKLHPMIDPVAMRDAYLAAKPADALFLDEKGQKIPGAEHDVFTGSDGQGRILTDKTCKDWTSQADGAGDNAQVGHSDTPAMQFSPSWNSAHETQGCSQAGVKARGGSGRLYCFATD